MRPHFPEAAPAGFLVVVVVTIITILASYAAAKPGPGVSGLSVRADAVISLF